MLHREKKKLADIDLKSGNFMFLCFTVGIFFVTSYLYIYLVRKKKNT